MINESRTPHELASACSALAQLTLGVVAAEGERGAVAVCWCGQGRAMMFEFFLRVGRTQTVRGHYLREQRKPGR